MCSDNRRELGLHVNAYESIFFVDPSNTFAGCKPKFIQGCQEGDELKIPGDVFELQPLQNKYWPNGDYEKMTSDSDQACRSSCMNDWSYVQPQLTNVERKGYHSQMGD